MSVFAVLLPIENPKLTDIIKNKFPEPDHYQITSTQWLVSAKGTAKQVSDTLGVSAKEKEDRMGSAVILAISSYWGVASTELWDWIKAKMEESLND
jgi:hypothetical protein